MSDAPDAVIAVSEKVRQYCIEVDGIEPNRVKTIYNGLDIDSWGLRSSVPRPSGRTAIATVGNIRPVKGHDVLIRAAASVAREFPEVVFSVAGDVLDPEYFQGLQGMLQEFSLTDRFHFVGAVTDLQSYLSAADIFVLPSRSEGFSNAIVEAMAAGIPVIATDVGGNAEAVEDGVTGIIVPSEDPDALAGGIIAMLSNRSEARRMGIAGGERAAARFTTEVMMRSTTKLYQELLSQFWEQPGDLGSVSTRGGREI
jgi:glycosyltransferase involved in cell wall biosynthesis